MRRSLHRFLMIPVLSALAGAACDDNVTTTIPTNPTLPSTVTETFSRSINPNGAATHTFSAARAGSITVTLNTLSPDAAVKVGLSLGTWNGESCYTVIARDSTVVGNSIVGTASLAGSFCVRVYDVGGLTAATSFDVQIVHP